MSRREIRFLPTPPNLSSLRRVNYGHESPFTGIAQICVTTYAKGSGSTDQLSVKNIFAIEHDIVPFDWADVLKQCQVDTVAHRITFIQHPVDFFGLPWLVDSFLNEGG
jgi:hypothetical protein